MPSRDGSNQRRPAVAAQTNDSSGVVVDTNADATAPGSDQGSTGISIGADPTSVMQSALANFDGLRVEAALRAGFDPRHSYIDPGKYRNALHELVLNYVSYTPADRPKKLHIKFIDILTVLLQAKLDINEVDHRNQTALHLVCSAPYGHNPEVINALLSAGARVNQPDAGQQTPLHRAVLHGSRSDVNVLLDFGADPNFFDNMGHSCLHVAAKRRNNEDILKLLVSRGCKVNLNNPEWAQKTKGTTALHTAARHGRIGNAEALLAVGADPNMVDSSGQTPLHVAATHEITGTLCTLLVKHGARSDIRDRLLGETALHKAVKTNSIDNVLAILNSPGGRNVVLVNLADANGDTAMHKAASCPNTDLAIWNALVTAGVKLMSQNADGQTPFDKATRSKNSLGEVLLKSHLYAQTD